ncbi:hypothetical protein KAR10_05790 [bacterium]|nr:hypothetical protein [bacterium]
MENSKLLVFFLSMFFIIFSGCATFSRQNEPVQKSNLTMGTVKTEIIKGETTQAEILKLFGAPNITTKNRDDDEVWNYNKMSYQSKTGADGGTFILWGGSRAMSSTTTKSFDLIIIFGKNDVVKDYSVISASY